MKLIRGIASLARWDGSTFVNRPDATTAGDVISDLRTHNNTLSVWCADSQEDINDAIVAMSLNRTDVSKMIALILDEAELAAMQIELSNSQPGKAPGAIESIKQKHRDLVEIDYKRLGELSDYMLRIVQNKDMRVELTKPTLTKLLEQYKAGHKIVLDENSKITKKIDNGIIKKNNMTIVRIKDIQNMNLYSIVDLCVVVLNVGEKMIKNTRNGSQPLKKIVVGDVSKYKIEISLWRVHSDTNVKFGDILLINNVKIGEYKGRTLTTFDETCIKINPPKTNEYVKELEEFIQKNDIKSEFLDLENTSEMKTETKEDSENYTSVHIRDVLESLDEFEDVTNLSKVTAIVTQILHNEKNYYPGCSDRNCKRKLKIEGDSDEYICPNCRKSTKNPTYYYTLSLRVKDASTEYWIDIFGKTAESIMKCTAEEYKDFLENRDDEKLKEITHKVEFKVFNFWVKPKIQTYNTVSKKKLYAYRIEPYNEKVEAHKLVRYLLKDI